MANYALGIRSIPEVENGHTFTECNFKMLNPHTPILTGVTGIKFIRCSLCNCDVPGDAVLVQSPRPQVNFCSYINSQYVALGLPVCTENCIHVVGTDVIQVAGSTVATVYHYENKMVA